MTFVNKKARVFMDRGDLKPIRRRSESRLKTYPSATDLRTWGDYVEQRRQHILELINTVPEKCFGRLIPLEAIINALMYDKDMSITELKKCLTQLWKFLQGCKLGDDDIRRFTELKNKMNKICIDAIGTKDSMEMKVAEPSSRMLGAHPRSQEHYEQEELSLGSSPSKQDSRKQAEVDKLTKGTYSVKAKGPIRIVTKVKGIPPGMKLPVGKITVKAQSPGKRKGTPLEEQPGEDLSTEERSRGARSDRTDGDKSAPYSGKIPSAASKDGSKMPARRSADTGRTADTRGEDDVMPTARSVGGRSADGRKKADDDRIPGARKDGKICAAMPVDNRKPTDIRRNDDDGISGARSVDKRKPTDSGRNDDDGISVARSVDKRKPTDSGRNDDDGISGARSVDKRKPTDSGRNDDDGISVARSVDKRKPTDSGRNDDDGISGARSVDKRKPTDSRRNDDDRIPGTRSVVNGKPSDSRRNDDDKISGIKSVDGRKSTNSGKDKYKLSFSGVGKPLAESSRIEDDGMVPGKRSVDSARSADSKKGDETSPVDGVRSADGTKTADGGKVALRKLSDIGKRRSEDNDDVSELERIIEEKGSSLNQRSAESKRSADVTKSADVKKSADVTKSADIKKSADITKSADVTKSADGGRIAGSEREVDKCVCKFNRRSEDNDDVSELERIIEEKESSLNQRSAKSKRSADVKKSADVTKSADIKNSADITKSADVTKSADGGRIVGSEREVDTTSYGQRSVHEKDADTDKDDTRLPLSERSEDEGKSSDEGVGDMPDNVQKLRDQLAARDALCEEQQNSIENLRNERDKLNKRIQECLVELEGLKKLNNVSDPGVPTSCKEEIEALEQEMEVMRSGNLSPEQEAELIKKEVDVLKKYCLKLKAVEEENQMLKSGRSMPSGDNEESAAARIQELERERDELAEKLKLLEQQAMQNKDLGENYEIYKNRSSMLDNALAERDQMQQKVDKMKQMEMQMEELKEKADRADELEMTLKYHNKNDRNTEYELKRAQSRCICLERDQQNLRSERDSMSKRIDLQNNELESLRSKARESEMLKVERDRLQIKMNDLSHVQVHNENLMLKCKCLEGAAVERDAYKMKYEEILGMECQCEMMKLQIEESRNMARERDALKKQVMDLESCIKEQEEEIKRLMAQIDNLMKNKDETQSRMRDALSNMRAEVDKKDQLIAASEEKLASVQSQLKSSIQGVSCETLCYKTRIEELERELCGARCRIGKLERQLTEKEEIVRGAKRTNKSECETVGVMKKELEAAKAENNKLQEIAKKMVTLTGDEHVQKMLRQSECAVRRVVEELGKQYREWDSMRSRSRTQKRRSQGAGSECCPCRTRYEDASDMESADEKLKDELRDIQREKDKLESIVRQIQAADGPQKDLVTMRMENEKLQEQLRSEIERRRALEQKLNKMMT